MKTIVIDQNAWDILTWAKSQSETDGIEKPSHSDAVRWIKNELDYAKESIQNKNATKKLLPKKEKENNKQE